MRLGWKIGIALGALVTIDVCLGGHGGWHSPTGTDLDYLVSLKIQQIEDVKKRVAKLTSLNASPQRSTHSEKMQSNTDRLLRVLNFDLSQMLHSEFDELQPAIGQEPRAMLGINLLWQEKAKQLFTADATEELRQQLATAAEALPAADARVLRWLTRAADKFVLKRLKAQLEKSFGKEKSQEYLHDFSRQYEALFASWDAEEEAQYKQFCRQIFDCIVKVHMNLRHTKKIGDKVRDYHLQQVTDEFIIENLITFANTEPDSVVAAAHLIDTNMALWILSNAEMRGCLLEETKQLLARNEFDRTSQGSANLVVEVVHPANQDLTDDFDDDEHDGMD
jgi:hypothetical protein